MFSPQKILRFWRRALQLLLPLYGSILLLAFLAIRLGAPGVTGWQLGARLVAGLVPAMLATAGGLILSCSYLQGLYGLKDKREAFWHVIHCLFGQASFRPWLKVETGKIDFQLTDENSFIAQVGGPGNTVIRKDSAAVFEQAGHLTRVEGPGIAILEPFERVYDTIDLRPRRWQHPVAALSKEGIPVTCEIDIEFQIQDGGQQPSSETPFPVDLQAAFAAVTCKWIREQNRPKGDQVLDWKGQIVVAAAEGTLRFILARYPLDRLMAPARDGQEHPRQAICKELEAALHTAAANAGAKILRVELGEISVKDEITQQWIETWQANWDRWGLEYLATSEAAYVEMMGETKSEAVVRRIRDTANILHELRQSSEEAFITGTKLQLKLAMRNIGSDSLALTYMPAEAMKLLQNVANLPSPSAAQKAGSPPSGSDASGDSD